MALSVSGHWVLAVSGLEFEELAGPGYAWVVAWTVPGLWVDQLDGVQMWAVQLTVLWVE